MATKMTGAQLKAFYNDPEVWSHEGHEGAWYLEEMMIKINGEEMSDGEAFDRYGDEFEKISDTAPVSIMDGYMGWQGPSNVAAQESKDIASEARRWLKAQTHILASVSFSLDRTQPDTNALIVAMVQALGGSVAGLPADAPKASAVQQAQVQAALATLRGPANATLATPAPRSRSSRPR